MLKFQIWIWPFFAGCLSPNVPPAPLSFTLPHPLCLKNLRHTFYISWLIYFYPGIWFFWSVLWRSGHPQIIFLLLTINSWQRRSQWCPANCPSHQLLIISNCFKPSPFSVPPPCHFPVHPQYFTRKISWRKQNRKEKSSTACHQTHTHLSQNPSFALFLSAKLEEESTFPLKANLSTKALQPTPFHPRLTPIEIYLLAL